MEQQYDLLHYVFISENILHFINRKIKQQSIPKNTKEMEEIKD